MRMFALEPRVLFDGALAADIVVEAGKVADAGASHASTGQADASAKAAAVPGSSEPVSVAPATVEVPGATQVSSAAAPAAERDTSKPGADASKAGGEANTPKEFDRVSDALGAPAARNEIVFVESTVTDYQVLLADVNPNARIVILDGGKDGIQQIADYMAHESNVDAIHIVSHGAEGKLELGTAKVDSESMRHQYAEQLVEIGRHLANDADILVYGCDFAKGEDGRDAAMRLSFLTGADVAASDNLTGSRDLGG